MNFLNYMQKLGLEKDGIPTTIVNCFQVNVLKIQSTVAIKVDTVNSWLTGDTVPEMAACPSIVQTRANTADHSLHRNAQRLCSVVVGIREL